MASSNRHWPSMFKSKPCNNPLHQWPQHDNGGCHRTSHSSGSGLEERTPEPKPRWNPRPEQIRILEAIFNSGMVNPPRDEIRRIRIQLQEYGQVGDANVFYWFQNRKSRTKHKQRQLQNAGKSQLQQSTAAPPPPAPAAAAIIAASSSSSSSSEKSSHNSPVENPIISAGGVPTPSVVDLLNSPSPASINHQSAAANASFFQSPTDFLPESFLFPAMQQNNAGVESSPENLANGFWFSDMPNAVDDQSYGNSPNIFLNELMLMNTQFPSKKDHDLEKTKPPTPADQNVLPPPLPSLPSLPNQGVVSEACPAKSTVFINDMCFEVAAAPFNVRDAFGDDAVLVQSPSGQAVLTNEWGETLQPLQHGGFYYLLRPFTSPFDESAIDMIFFFIIRLLQCAVIHWKNPNPKFPIFQFLQLAGRSDLINNCKKFPFVPRDSGDRSSKEGN
ncbi:WUSCHEL-related homeobox 9-like [Andrographis paniculata]|uniref:WUSCHEL-related homeobox 9-like n=1 Tax=Andrographis paniculata TaxID=175694 RepID=UPI0021E91EB4|nr:WUSCHEL-related homeobox 9-like [Andrographis paniculata]